MIYTLTKHLKQLQPPFVELFYCLIVKMENLPSKCEEDIISKYCNFPEKLKKNLLCAPNFYKTKL